jgi:hypothetical protein
MTFTLCYYNKHSKMAINPLSLAFSYAIEMAVGSGDTIYIEESDFTDKCGFRDLMRVLKAYRLRSGSNIP